VLTGALDSEIWMRGVLYVFFSLFTFAYNLFFFFCLKRYVTRAMTVMTAMFTTIEYFRHRFHFGGGVLTEIF